MDLIKLTQSKILVVAIVIVASLLLLFLAFRVGVSVGYQKARFSYQWGENYDRNFGGPHHGVFGFLNDKGYMNAHGTAGQIIRIDPSASSGGAANLMVRGQDGMEKTILITDSTSIREHFNAVKPGDLKINDSVVVIGAPNDQGQIVAEFIRILN